MIENEVEVLISLPSVREEKIKVPSKSKVSELKKIVCKKFMLEPEYTQLNLDGKNLELDVNIEALDVSGKKIVVDYLWARHLLLWSPKMQAKLRKSTVLIAGAGAIGSEVAKNLALIGVKRLVIVDYDVVEASNISRMLFFTLDDEGKPKAETLGARIVEKYPFVEVYAYTCALEQLPLETYLNSDVIVSGLDNIASRIYLAAIAHRLQIPMIDAGTLGYKVRVQTYIPSNTPCPACNYPPEKYAELVKLRNPCDPKLEENKVPSVITANSLAASIQTQEILKILLGYKLYRTLGKWPQNSGQPINGVFIADLKYNKFSIIQFEKNKKCVVCGEKGLAKPAKRQVVSIKKVKSTTDLFEILRKKIGSDLELYTTSSMPPQKILTDRRLDDYNIKRGSHIIALVKSAKEFEELIFTIN
ncbi:MAG: ThiF family adenylyltransferase [Candidatus Bathyarchaeia archaeon]